MNTILQKLEEILDDLAKLIMKLAPVAQAAAPFTGPYAGAVIGGAAAAGIIAAGVDQAIQAHEASGGSQEGALQGAVHIIDAVTSASVLDTDTTAKLRAIIGALAPPTVGVIGLRG